MPRTAMWKEEGKVNVLIRGSHQDWMTGSVCPVSLHFLMYKFSCCTEGMSPTTHSHVACSSSLIGLLHAGLPNAGGTIFFSFCSYDL